MTFQGSIIGSNSCKFYTTPYNGLKPRACTSVTSESFVVYRSGTATGDDCTVQQGSVGAVVIALIPVIWSHLQWPVSAPLALEIFTTSILAMTSSPYPAILRPLLLPKPHHLPIIMSNPISHQPMTASINQHHVHREDEPLPGAKGAEPAVDYSPETMERTKLPISEEGNTQDFSPHTKPQHNQPATQEPVGAGLGGESKTLGDEHMSGATPKPSFGDKVIGKTQELTGKVLNKEPLKEKGELRKQGEKI